MPSKLIRRTSYDPATRTLSVWLVTNEKRYDYEEVSPETYGAFRAAFSKGWFFNHHIRPNHTLRQVAEGGTTKAEEG